MPFIDYTRRERPRPTWRGTVLTLALGLWPSLTGCIDPAGKFDDFVKRKEEASKAPEDAGGSADAGPIYLPEPDQMNGSYLYVVDLDVEPGKPTIYELEAKAEKGDKQYTITLRNRPLKYQTYDMPVGDWSDWTSSTVDVKGIYTTPTISITAPAASNALNQNVASTLVFVGDVGNARYQDDDQSKHVEFFCGTVSGTVAPAAGFNLMTSGTFSATYISDPNNLPAVVLDCSGKKPTW